MGRPYPLLCACRSGDRGIRAVNYITSGGGGSNPLIFEMVGNTLNIK